MESEELGGRPGTADPTGEDAGEYSGSHAGAKHALNDSRPARPAFSFRRDLESVRAVRAEQTPRMRGGAVAARRRQGAESTIRWTRSRRPARSGRRSRSASAEDWIEVADNGPGMPAELVARLCDRSLRTSSREAWPTPERGRQGNALQVLMCLAFGLGLERVEHTITSQGIRHTITLTVDRLAQRIMLERQEVPVEPCSGTIVRIGFPVDQVPFGQLNGLRNLIIDFGALNPHCRFHLRDLTGYVDDDDEPIIGDLEIASIADGIDKWDSAAPVPPHWYSLEKFGHRILLELIRDPDLTIAQFLGTFRGLSSTQRRSTVAAATGLTGAKLSALLDGRSIDTGRAGRLLTAMQAASRPPKPAALGGVGKDLRRGPRHRLS